MLRAAPELEPSVIELVLAERKQVLIREPAVLTSGVTHENAVHHRKPCSYALRSKSGSSLSSSWSSSSSLHAYPTVAGSASTRPSSDH